MKDFFIFCAGSNKDILGLCPEDEVTKHVGFGTLILAPTMLAMFSMMFTLEIFIENKIIIISGGIMWGLLIFSMDRFLVSSFSKEETIMKDIFSLKFALRIILSLFLGIAISHPLVLLYFRDTIEERNFEVQKIELNEIYQKNQITLDSLKGINIIEINSIQEKIEKIEKDLKCYTNLLTYEQSGVKKETECGPSSGLVKCGERCANIEKIRGDLSSQIDDKEEKIKNLQAVFENKEKIIISKISQEQNLKTNSFSNDYSKRQQILDILSEERNDVKKTSWFILFFLIFVDILPVLLKALSTRGAYDDLKIDFQKHSVASGKKFLEIVQSKDSKLAEINDRLMLSASEKYLNDGEIGEENTYKFPLLVNGLLKRQLITTLNLFHRLLISQRNNLTWNQEIFSSRLERKNENYPQTNKVETNLDKWWKPDYSKFIGSKSPEEFGMQAILLIFSSLILFFIFGEKKGGDRLVTHIVAWIGVIIFTWIYNLIFKSDNSSINEE